MQCFTRYVAFLLAVLLFEGNMLTKFISAEEEFENELTKTDHHKKFQTKIVVPTVSGITLESFMEGKKERSGSGSTFYYYIFHILYSLSTSIRLRCKHLHQYCRFSQDCCPGTYCYEDEGDSHKRHCDI
ncbi:hypothetical protein HNY73_000373 [Argiope bruennichi]|uniref:Uncharacterized protein n=1 Tax=Argiope bruennichi TaxID=94029 RepID=A0A8T0FXX0_ARGBR|nr:hypothetical protein HNY73_000373 [Argiope bruennichi]